MINHSYNEGYILVPILIIASLFNVVVGLLGALYVAKKDTRKIANTSIISAIINVVLHLLLIKHIGLLAAPISTFCSFFLMSLYRIYDVNKSYFKINVNVKNILIMLLIVIFICFGYYYDAYCCYGLNNI